MSLVRVVVKYKKKVFALGGVMEDLKIKSEYIRLTRGLSRHGDESN